MIYDSLGVPIIEGMVLWSISHRSLVFITRLDVGDPMTSVYGILLEWRHIAYVGEDRLWGRFFEGVLVGYEVVGVIAHEER